MKKYIEESKNVEEQNNHLDKNIEMGIKEIEMKEDDGLVFFGVCHCSAGDVSLS